MSRSSPRPGSLACISHHPTVEAHDTTAMTSLRLLAVLDVLSSTPARAKRRAPRPDGPLTHFASPRGEKYRLVRTFLVLAFASAFGQWAEGADKVSPDDLQFFESKIRPVLARHCYRCHSAEAETQMGGLSLDSRVGILRGGQRGEAIVPGSVDDSLLLQALSYESDLKMPPTGKLSDQVIVDFTQWIERGAPDPREQEVAAPESQINLKKGRQYWAFQTPKRPKLPPVNDLSWPRGAVDQFLLAKREQAGLPAVADADRPALLRRATFDLLGLPPTPEEIDSFVNDPDDHAFRKVVDRLLQSPRFGERWGRHWLDVARYGETMGRTLNFPFPVAWRYRDYVIDAFNRDKPYDRFVSEQIAGDLLPSESIRQRREQVTATGFLALGAHDLNEPDRVLYPMDVADEMINVTSRSILALSVGCARCHDHKFDPIPTRDYYALAGIFRSTELKGGLRQRPKYGAAYFRVDKLLRLERASGSAESGAGWAELRRAELWRQIKDAVKAEDRKKVRDLSKELDELPLPWNVVMGVEDSAAIQRCRVNIGGDPHTLGEEAPRGFLQVLDQDSTGRPNISNGESGRLQLVQWLVRRDNPLTARVMVNRIWHHLFGRGLVPSVDNFGKMGEQPSHPELLDYLAVQFMDQGWSVKSVIREIMLSRTYQLSTGFYRANFENDPDNKFLWRMNRRRLEVEAIRDAMLYVSGELKLEPPRGSPVHRWKRNGQVRAGNKQLEPWDVEQNYRSVYVPVIRTQLSRFFETFDFPEASETHGARDVTTVATQALFFMNSPFVRRQASAASERLLASTADDYARVEQAYRQVLSREPTRRELEQALAFVRSSFDTMKQTESPASQAQQAWGRLYQALFGSAEFRYRG